MLTISEVRGEDIRAGRLLCRLTCDDLAHKAKLSHDTVHRVEGGAPYWPRTQAHLVEVLWGLGVRFVGHGDVRHLDGRIAPTKRAVGAMRGSRLTRARNSLGIPLPHLAGLARVGTGALTRMEATSRDMTECPTLGFYAVVGALQLAGYSFGPATKGGRTNDRRLVAKPPRQVREPSLHRLRRAIGLGLPRELEAELAKHEEAE